MVHIDYRNDMKVKLVDSMGNDYSIAQAARVEYPEYPLSVEFAKGSPQTLSAKDEGLLNMLMRDRHGTPWEHVVFKFYIEAPIFVAREAHRHRIASINEESGRYKELGPVFYIPTSDRNLQQQGKPGAYVFTPGTKDQVLLTRAALVENCRESYLRYTELLEEGVAREVARMLLPVNIYTSWYLTINLRSLFNFLSLRRKTEETTVPTFPQREIEMVAEQMEDLAHQVTPKALDLFNKNGRVSP